MKTWSLRLRSIMTSIQQNFCNQSYLPSCEDPSYSLTSSKWDYTLWFTFEAGHDRMPPLRQNDVLVGENAPPLKNPNFQKKGWVTFQKLHHVIIRSSLERNVICLWLTNHDPIKSFPVNSAAIQQGEFTWTLRYLLWSQISMVLDK